MSDKGPKVYIFLKNETGFDEDRASVINFPQDYKKLIALEYHESAIAEAEGRVRKLELEQVEHIEIIATEYEKRFKAQEAQLTQANNLLKSSFGFVKGFDNVGITSKQVEAYLKALTSDGASGG